jgi:hypothetical protein
MRKLYDNIQCTNINERRAVMPNLSIISTGYNHEGAKAKDTAAFWVANRYRLSLQYSAEVSVMPGADLEAREYHIEQLKKSMQYNFAGSALEKLRDIEQYIHRASNYNPEAIALINALRAELEP